MNLQKEHIGSTQKGLINYLKNNKFQTVVKKITKLGIASFLIFNISNCIVNPYQYYELFTNQTDNQIISDENVEIVNSFCEIISKLPDEWKANFNNNFGKLKIYNVSLDLVLAFNDASGYYNGDSRIITKNKTSYGAKEVIDHELIHMASDNGKNIGLTLTHNKIGKALNEGYTNYLAHSLFDCKADIYRNQTLCAQIFDNIIGTEKMMEYYFTSNGEGLINEISLIYQNGDNIIYGKSNEEECNQKAMDLIQLIDKTLSEEDKNEMVEIKSEIADKCYELAIYNKLWKKNINYKENPNRYYNLHIDRQIIEQLELLNPSKSYHVELNDDFNKNHPVVIKTFVSSSPLETPNLIVQKYNINNNKFTI